MKCARCSGNAEIDLKYAKTALCNQCFAKLFESRVRKNIRVNRLLKPTDKTAVALSGGKDSAVVLYLLSLLHRKAPRSELIAITIDEGKKQGGDKTLEVSRALCKRLGIEHQVFSFESELGVTLDWIVEKSKSLKNPAPPCTYCGILRRRLLNDKARELGVTKLATGHNLDDEVQVGLMNYIRGDLDRLSRMGAFVGSADDDFFIPRIKPLRDCPEEEVLHYAHIKELEFEPARCIYSRDAFRRTVKSAVDLIEKNHPGSKFQTLKSTDRLKDALKTPDAQKPLEVCTVCSQRTSGELCRFCQIKKEFGF